MAVAGEGEVVAVATRRGDSVVTNGEPALAVAGKANGRGVLTTVRSGRHAKQQVK